ncbi:MAG: DUF4185 domain-containing protein [Flavisolibacter sp.]
MNKMKKDGILNTALKITGINILVYCPIIFLLGCNHNLVASLDSGSSKPSKVLISKAVPEWSNMLRHDRGWIGADGIYSLAMNGVERPGQGDSVGTMFWFSDTMLGEIANDSLKPGWDMIHNSVAYMAAGQPNPGSIKFYWNKTANNANHAMFEPSTPHSKPGEYYWLGDGFVDHAADSTIYIFAYRIRNVEGGGVYPFQDLGVSLIALPKGSRPPFANQRQLDTPLFFKDKNGQKVVFGNTVLANTVGAGAPHPDGYIYVYGIRGPQKDLVVGRVNEKEFENFSAWQYWDGQAWSKDGNDCAALTNNVSNEMSVSFMEDGRVMAVYQLNTNSPDVVIQVGKTPAGPFQPVKKIWETPEVKEDLDFYTYNAKAHPHLSKPGELLISYNVNSFDFLDDISKHPYHLRPRFISFKYK